MRSRLKKKATQATRAPSRSSPLETQPVGCWTGIVICLLLVLAVWVVFGQTVRHGFVNYDDDVYVYQNGLVAQGFSLRGLVWALTYSEIGHWHPLTWCSHMLDCQLYGLNPAGHHFTNVLLHAAAAVVLFLVLRRLTGDLFPSAFVAAIFAVHPLKVESVAWVAERKDVLSGLFFMLTLLAYIRFAQNQKIAAPSPSPFFRSGFYWLALMCFALGLLSKGILVTIPFLLLLLDYWPLQRFVWPQVLWDKIPFLALSAASCAATSMVSEKILPGDSQPFTARAANAVISCVTYLWQTVFPHELLIPYLYPAGGFALGKVMLALTFVLLVSVGAIIFLKRWPFFFVGWFWYLGTLAPVAGLVQISYYARADRYTYLPQIGLCILATWGLVNVCRNWRDCEVVLGPLAIAIVVCLMSLAHRQTAYWNDSVSLWTHTLACQPANAVAHNNLGEALSERGEVGEAIQHFNRALQINPDYAQAENNLGSALKVQGHLDEAIQHYQQAVTLNPDYAQAHNNLGSALQAQGKWDEAIQEYERALQLRPDDAQAENGLGFALRSQGNLADASRHYQRALQLDPGYALAHYNLADILQLQGNLTEAIQHYERALSLQPDFAQAQNNLGNALQAQGDVADAIQHYQGAAELNPHFALAENNWGSALDAQGKPDGAIQHYQRAVELEPNFAMAHYNLGYDLGAEGKMDEAFQQYQKALELATVQSNTTLAGIIRSQLNAYKAVPK